MTLNQRTTFLVAFGGVLVASRMYVSTSALLSCYERVFSTKIIAYFMISEYWTFGVQNLFIRTREPFFSNLRTFGLKNLRTHEPSNLRTFGRIGCNRSNSWCFPVRLLSSCLIKTVTWWFPLVFKNENTQSYLQLVGTARTERVV